MRMSSYETQSRSYSWRVRQLRGACVEPRILESVLIWVSFERAWKDKSIDTMKCVLALFFLEKNESIKDLPSYICAQELESVPNLHVIKACQSLKSKGMVTEQFAWRHYYW